MRSPSGMDQGGGSGAGEMQADSGCISEVEPAGCGKQSDGEASETKG